MTIARSYRMGSLLAGSALMLAMTSAAFAGGTEIWPFDATTSGNDVSITTATATNPKAAIFDAAIQISDVDVTVTYFGFPFTVDVTDQVPEEFRNASVSSTGPLPITVFAGTIAYPQPPEPPSVSADLTITVDDNGFGHVLVENVMLGMVTVDLGLPFGTVTVQITQVHVAGTVTVTAIDQPGDLDGSGAVNLFDLLDLLAVWGECEAPCPPRCAADISSENGAPDCAVNLFDLLALLANWG